MWNKTMHLTPTEHGLLTCLVQNPGRIVTHEELLEAMSSGGTITVDNLRHCILHLRKKIEIDPALPRVIITYRRLGYSFAGKEEARSFPGFEPSP